MKIQLQTRINAQSVFSMQGGGYGAFAPAMPLYRENNLDGLAKGQKIPIFVIPAKVMTELGLAGIQ